MRLSSYHRPFAFSIFSSFEHYYLIIAYSGTSQETLEEHIVSVITGYVLTCTSTDVQSMLHAAWNVG